jgi:hypothetical protein
MPAPTNVRELIAHLTAHRRVVITGPTPRDREPHTRPERFHSFAERRLWFLPEDPREPIHFIPVSSSLTDAAARAEPGLTFDDDGFTFTRFGVSVRVDYVPDQDGEKGGAS